MYPQYYSRGTVSDVSIGLNIFVPPEYCADKRTYEETEASVKDTLEDTLGFRPSVYRQGRDSQGWCKLSTWLVPPVSSLSLD